MRKANDTITVSGASIERNTSDCVDWSVEVSQSGPNQLVFHQGIGPDELELDSVKSEKQDVRDPRTGELSFTTWRSRQTILIGSRNVNRIHTISGRIDQLLVHGTPLTINEPAHTFTKHAGKRVHMLAKATKDARARAQAIASEAGSGIGAITNADTGTFQITAPNSIEASSSGSYDTRTIDADITAVMTVTFRVD